MLGPVLVLLGILAVFPSAQGQKSSLDRPSFIEKIALDLGEILPVGEQSKGLGTSLTKQDFINGQKWKNKTSLEDAKKNMQLALKNKGKFDGEKLSLEKHRSVQKEVKYRWPNGEVPYIVETVFTDDDKAAIASAIQNIQDNSCVTFRQAISTDLDFVNIFTTNASGCTGHRFYGPGYGEHQLNLEGDSGDGLTCIDRGVIIHELLHMLGFNHEHQRPDRDTMVTVNWDNVQVDKAHNFIQDSFDTEDLTLALICNTTEVPEAAADFSGCVSGDVVTAYGVGYDFYSIMHYGFDSFAADTSVPTMVPSDASVTSPGNVELSSMDITKLQKAYGCSGCGGYKRSSVGGTISGLGTSDLLSPCEWVLETDDGKGISIDITALTGLDCSTDYVEVRMGSSSDGQLVGKYCGNSLPGPVNTAISTVWVKWVKSETSSSMSANWSPYEVECCQSVVLENMDNLPTVKFNMTDQQVNERPVYKLVDGLTDVYYLYWVRPYGWFVGEDPTTTFSVALNKGKTVCPEETTDVWEYATTDGFVPDDDAKLRCSDCKLYPSYPECEECCDTVTLSSTFDEFLNPSQYYSQFYGQFTYSGVMHNSHKVYQSDIFSSVCLFFSSNWIIYYCSDLNTGSRWIQAPGTKCVQQATGWIIFSQVSGEDVTDESLSFNCPATSKSSTAPATLKPSTRPATMKPSTPPTTIKPSTPPATIKPSTPPATIKPSTPPATIKPSAPPSTKLPMPLEDCLPCKDIKEGPMMGSYFLEEITTADPRCVDACVYSKGEDLYCFAHGEDFVFECE